MALAKDPKPYDSQMALVQACTYYGNMFGGGSSAQVVSDQSSPELSVFKEHHKAVTEEGEKASGLVKNFATSRSSSLSSPISSTNSNLYGAAINFKSGYNNFMHNTSGSFLRFEQNDPSPQNSYQKMSHQDGDYSICWEDFNCVQSAASSIKENQHGGEPFRWPISESNAEEACFNKRPHTGESMQALKRQCNSATRKPKQTKSTPSKDPQSVAAKNRRERISERLKVLQELVPNGSKVDLVTMLEKAISYVKFLQLQVKVLATDEFWPVQGRKAPDLSQVKEAIDAILNSSQKDRNSSSK